MSVYFLRVGSAGPIKIGCTGHIKKRVAEIQAHHHRKIKIIFTKPQWGQPQERALHKKFKKHRMHGEWFRPHKDIFDFMKNPVKLVSKKKYVAGSERNLRVISIQFEEKEFTKLKKYCAEGSRLSSLVIRAALRLYYKTHPNDPPKRIKAR